jgi:CcmD family protein
VTRLIFATIVTLMLLGAPAIAQQPAPKAPVTAAQDGFVPVDAPMNPQDTIPAPRLVAIAYGFIWVVLFGYVWSVRSRLGRVEREMETVSRRIAASRK